MKKGLNLEHLYIGIQNKQNPIVCYFRQETGMIQETKQIDCQRSDLQSPRFSDMLIGCFIWYYSTTSIKKYCWYWVIDIILICMTYPYDLFMQLNIN